MHWDIFCRVIDNYGDIGVCWRLSADLALRGHRVRLWIDQTEALDWMAPGAIEGHWPGIDVLPWQTSLDGAALQKLAPSDVWIEGFGCELPASFVAHFAPIQSDAPPRWINLEYLSAESYVERSHGLPSPIMSGPAKGWLKYFYYPGFTAETGGLLREPPLHAGEPRMSTAETAQFLQSLGITWQGERLISLFCYATAPVAALLDALTRHGKPTLLLATHGVAQKILNTLETPPPPIRIAPLPAMPQPAFDTLLRCADVNFVRGEDSLVRAIWANKPFIWNIYPQDDGAHAPKLQAFLKTMQWDQALEALHYAWNGLIDAQHTADAMDWLSQSDGGEWQARIDVSGARLRMNRDLTSALVDFVNKKR